ncbi:MAG: efflux RND transporter periplasmic adaptor subunit [Gemmataceae bacterium]
MRLRTLRRRFALGFFLLLAVPLGCAEQAAPPERGPAVVAVSQPIVRDVTDQAVFTGRTEAVESVQVRARVSGYLQDVLFQAGQEVKEGQQLFQIDPTIYQAALEKARAEVAQYQSEVTLSTQEYERGRRLTGTGAVSREEFEKLASQRERASANLAAARATVTTTAQNLTWTKVISPINGKAGVNLLTKGNLVIADQTLLTTIVSQDPMYVYFDVDESTVLRVQELIRKGRVVSYQKAAYPVAIGLTSESGFPRHGVIDYVSNQVNPGTGTLNVRGKFANADRVLTPGLFVRVRLPIGGPHRAVLVTDRALGSDQGQRFLLVVDADNHVVRRDVRVGALHDGGLREIRAGLNPDEWVIVDGLLRVRPGLTVAPTRGPMPAGPVDAAASPAAPPAAPAPKS